jgi:xanthine dehydrogenase accessory factor
VRWSNAHILVIGGGDLASGVIYRLARAGFPVWVTELPAPLFVRRAVCYGEAVYAGEVTVEGITAQRVTSLAEGHAALSAGHIPVMVDPDGDLLRTLQPVAVVDARMEKRNVGITRDAAPLVIALGPGFTAGEDVHTVVETNRGHFLGRVYWQGSAQPDTGSPGAVKGITTTRVLRAPIAGHVTPHYAIGDTIHADDVIATVGGQPLVAQFDGVLRGIVHPNVQVHEGMKIGDLDPRNHREACFTISDKSLSVGGGVLEALLASDVIHGVLT